jgi:hypothetical protein
MVVDVQVWVQLNLLNRIAEHFFTENNNFNHTLWNE